MMWLPTTIPFSIDWLPDGQLLVVAGPGSGREWPNLVIHDLFVRFVDLRLCPHHDPNRVPERACPEHHWRVPGLPRRAVASGIPQQPLRAVNHWTRS